MGTRDVAASKANKQAGPWGHPGIGTWISENPQVQLLTYEDAASSTEGIIFHAMNGMAAVDSLKMAGERALNGKILIDISNPLDFSKGFPPSLFLCNDTSLGEQIQAAFPGLKVVKSLNTMTNPVMINPRLVPGDHTVFLSGNDPGAKASVTALLKEFGWEEKNILDLGDITTARGTEMLLPIWARIYSKLRTPFFNFHINVAAQRPTNPF